MRFGKLTSDNYIRYFITKPIEDKQGTIAKSLEFFIGLFVIWLLTAFYMLYLWGGSLTVMLGTFVLMMGEYKFLKHYRNKRQGKRKTHYKMWLAGEKCMENIDKKLSNKEFKKLIKEVLINTEGFSKIKDNKTKEKTGIDFIARYNNISIGIRCEPVENQNNKLSVQCLHETVDDLEKMGYRNGIIITNGLIGCKTKTMAEKLKKDYAVTLLDRYQLVEYARKAEHEVFPAAHIIEQLDIANEEQKNIDHTPIKNKLIGDKHKAVNYFTAAMILGVMYYLIGDMSFFGYIYLLFSVVNIILGILSMLHGKSKFDLEAIQCINPEKKPG